MAARAQRRSLILSNTRLGVFLIGAVLAWLAFITGVVAGIWVLLPVLVFMVLVGLHNRVVREGHRARKAVRFYEESLARLEHRWMGRGETGDHFADASHPYAEDLDLFGRGSLFELLCMARTKAGQETLAGWLKEPAPPEEIRLRHAAVEELRNNLDLREDLALLGEDVRSGIHPEALIRWSTSSPVLDSHWARGLAYGLNGLVLGVLGGWLFGPLGLAPVLLALVLQGLFVAHYRTRVHEVIGAVGYPGRELSLLSQVLARLEAESFSSPLLKKLRAALDTEGLAPSRRIARLSRLIDFLDWRRNQFFVPLATLLTWATHLAFAMERWRMAAGATVPGWIQAVGELETLCSLARQAYEHPEDTFPEILEQGMEFHAEAIGHPLLPETSCIRNDLTLSQDLRLLMVSGSNMSGKSTLLRTIGINTVMAQAGAPVRARHLRLSPLKVGASIRINDSLQAGKSRFYAEITRIRELVAMTDGRRPLLFLLDEILHGTNSHDRQIGAEAVVRTLVQRGGMGLVTTHDLALARVTESLAPQAANIHFQDHLENGHMIFDYRIYPGVVEKSNALELMRSIGLDV